MERKRFQLRNILVYTCILTGILLFVRFPSEKFAEYVDDKLSSAIPGAVIKPVECSYSFPTSLVCDSVRVVMEGDGSEVALAENVKVSLRPLGFGRRYGLSGNLYNGTFLADLVIAPLKGFFTVVNIRAENIELEGLTVMTNMFQRKLSGSLKYSGKYSGSFTDSNEFSVDGVVKVDSGSFALRQPLLTMKSVSIEQMQVNVQYNDGVLKLNRGTLKGPEISSAFGGEVRTANSLPGLWDVDLHGTIIPAKRYLNENPLVQRTVKRMQRQYQEDELPYMIRGSIRNPRFQFGTE